ncbi:ATP-NAD kinase [Methanoplanus sp. FWC-SCC4]|uniref:ATP-NAD kinase n=2 Tax=Methanochimaera problematica TaxID=2609417 RepID=A0AA97FDL5_9EURY|nr:ATP-NAD kinase [Methanoplanus sp. FWC-SCC4]
MKIKNSEMKKIGFLINPVAGMGGKVALKGTDGQYERALELGAEPVAEKKAAEFVRALDLSEIMFFTAGGLMGEGLLKSTGTARYKVVFNPNNPTSAEDTKKACLMMLKAGVEMIVFCGGDGTARDVVSATGDKVPLLGIPSGVKMFSGIFALTPKTGADIVNRFPDLSIVKTEVMDIDEEEYRKGRLKTVIFAEAKVPLIPQKSQGGKWVSSGSDERNRKEIGRFLAEILSDDTLYLIGAGTTAKSILDELGLSGYTLLGIDALFSGRLIGRDLSERDILKLLEGHKKAKIIISPIGAQGFILGRGNQQFSPEVLRKTGTENIIIAATNAKLMMTKELFIDTGDMDLNRSFPDSVQVICGDCMAQRVKIQKPGQ